MTPPVALTIAGSDSGGGAGIQADLKMFAARGVFGTSAITAITAQNTVGVERVDILDAAIVAAQIDAVMSDLKPRAAKTGMLAAVETVDLVAERAAAGRLPPLVVDPVMVASSGDRLLDEHAEQAYLDHLFPVAAVITPNLLEASVLLGADLLTIDEMVDGARALAGRGADWVVIKGGHLEGDAVDVVHERHTNTTFHMRAPRIETANVHGTGCSLAAAITAHLAIGADPESAIRQANQDVHRAIAGAARWHLGAGHGPIDPLDWRDKFPPVADLHSDTDNDTQEHP